MRVLLAGMKTPSSYIQPAPLGLFDAQDRREQIRQLGDPLAALEAVLDWTIFLPVLARIPRAERRRPGVARPMHRCCCAKFWSASRAMV